VTSVKNRSFSEQKVPHQQASKKCTGKRRLLPQYVFAQTVAGSAASDLIWQMSGSNTDRNTENV